MRRRRISIIIAASAGFAISACCAQFPITVILVRHAEISAAPPGDPVLSDAGKLRAKTLAANLAGAGVTAIYASEAARTQLTVKPLADRLRVEINKLPADQPDRLAQAILSGKGRVVLVAGHSNRIPEIIQALGGGPVPGIAEAWEFDNLYQVTVYAPGKASTLRIHYGQPSSPASARLVAKGGKMMRITFGRSGGVVAAPGLTIEATLDLSGGKARVTDAGSGYVRDLPANEAEQVRGMIDTGRFFQLPAELRPPGGPSVADRRQYDIGVHLDDGSEHSVKVSETMSDELEQRSPGLGKFLAWIKQECDRIMSYRIGQR